MQNFQLVTRKCFASEIRCHWSLPHVPSRAECIASAQAVIPTLGTFVYESKITPKKSVVKNIRKYLAEIAKNCEHMEHLPKKAEEPTLGTFVYKRWGTPKKAIVKNIWKCRNRNCEKLRTRGTFAYESKGARKKIKLLENIKAEICQTSNITYHVEARGEHKHQITTSTQNNFCACCNKKHENKIDDTVVPTHNNQATHCTALRHIFVTYQKELRHEQKHKFWF